MPLQIKTVSNTEVQALIDLWLQCFPEDDPAYPREFLQLIDLSSAAIVGFVDEKPVTMLFLAPATARLGERTYRVRYLYAGCTHPSYRRHGYYEELMLQAFEKVKSWGEDAIYLYPAEKSLFAYYKRLGYRAGITCAAPTENSFWWDLDEPIREFFSATQEGSAARGECLWIPVREDNALAKSMLNNVAYTYLVGN